MQHEWISDVCELSHLVTSNSDYSPPGSSVHGIFHARILEWVAMPSSRGSQPRDRTQVSHIEGRRFTVWATEKRSLTSWRQHCGWVTAFAYVSDKAPSKYSLKWTTQPSLYIIKCNWVFHCQSRCHLLATMWHRHVHYLLSLNSLWDRYH